MNKWSSNNLRETAKRQPKQALTPQQRDILALIAAEPGLTAKEIALRLNSTKSAITVQIFHMKPLLPPEIKLINGYVVQGAE